MSSDAYPRARTGRRRTGGRIRPEDRLTDDTTATNTGGELSADHQAAIFSTQHQGMSAASRKDHRNRIRRIINWLREKYPDVCDASTVVVSVEMSADPSMYYFDGDEYDLKYAGLDPQYILAFLAELKNSKAGGKYYGVSHMSKFYDAIKWGSVLANQRLSTNFYSKLDTFLAAYKREYADQKKEGNVDEREADAISSTLLTMLMKWAVLEGNVFVWAFALLMWHLMARSINIDSVALHAIKRGISDSITFKYDETKVDKTGEFVCEKNVYSNPHDPFVCVFTALGCYLSINSEMLEGTERLFIARGTKYTSASQNFARQVAAMGVRYADQIKSFLRLSHFNIHGVRKGSGTHASSATTCPPLFTSIACRGEWSMGKILDIYFRFAAGGDYYLGQLLSLKDPTRADFATPCPHWRDPADHRVYDAIKLTFGKVLLDHEHTEHDPFGVLSMLLASMVHHSCWIMQVIESDPAHPFSKIPLMSSPLLGELKEHCLTFDLNEHVPRVTGIPPHIEHLCRIEEVRHITLGIKGDISDFRQHLSDSVSDAIDKKVRADGGINSAILDERLKNMEALLLRRMDDLDCSSTRHVAALPGTDGDVLDMSGLLRRSLFTYDGKFWCVPKDFAFPIECTRLHGWRMWLMGKMVMYDGKPLKVKPFRLMRGSELPSKKLATELHTKWQPIYRKMMEAPGVKPIPDEVDEEFVQSTYTTATEYLKQVVSYVWSKADEGRISKYTIGTWSRKVARSEIELHGTPGDISRLPPAGKRNKADQSKRSGWKINKSTVRRVVARRQREQVDRVAVNDLFGEAFDYIPEEPE